MTFELIRIWIRIPIQFLNHLGIGLNLENGPVCFLIRDLLIQFRVSNYNLLHLITLFKVINTTIYFQLYFK